MSAPQTRFRPPGRFAWLLWLAMLLPMAQAAAAWHLLSHARGEVSSERGDKPALHAAHCDICLSAAVVGVGALPGHAPVLPSVTFADTPPRGPVGTPRFVAVERPYESRAPPASLS
jgi:hypothetical protein